MIRCKNVFFLAMTLHLGAFSFAAIRVVTYNTAGDARADIDTVLESIGNEDRNGIARPVDILMLQEQDSVSTTTQQIVNVLNSLYGSGTYNRGVVNGDSTGAGRPGIIYNTNTIELLGEYQVNSTSSSGAARSTMRYKLRLAGYSSPDAIVYAYVSHFKATQGDEYRRGVEAQQVRDDADSLGDGVHIIYAGDLNLYDSYEPAWANLTASGNGQAFDPANRVGDWHNSYSFTDVHTQSPVTSEHFPGQITAGMDDRFDFQLITGELKDNEGLSYIGGSYRAFGNNDTHGLNNDISDGTGASPAALAALENTSDHIPVVADYQIPAKLTATIGTVPDELEFGAIEYVAVTVENTADVDVVAGADELDYSIVCSGSVLGSDSGLDPALGGGQTHYFLLDTSAIGTQNGTITISTNSQGAEILPGSDILNVQFEVIDSGQLEYHTFGWEGYDYFNDPNAVLAASGNVSYTVANADVYAGENCLKIQPVQSGDGVYTAIIDNLEDGDVVNASLYVKNLLAASGAIRLGAVYLSDSTDPASIVSTVDYIDISSSATWEQIGHAWTYDSAAGSHDGLMIYIEPQQDVLIDEMTVWFTMRGEIALPTVTPVACPEYSEMDYNQDCFVNFYDFVNFAQYWMDGTPGGTSQGTLDTVIMTGIMDGTLSFDTPSVIELRVNGTQDLSEYSIQRLPYGGSWETPIALSGVYTDTYVYLISSNSNGVSSFDAIFGTSGVYANRALISDSIDCIGGRDAFRILKNSAVIDQIYYDASVSTRVYRDSYMYRINSTGPDAGWESGNWMIPGENILDYLSPEDIRAAVPFGTYSHNPNCTAYPEYDYSNDCQINLDDVLFFVDDWLTCNLQPGWACLP